MTEEEKRERITVTLKAIENLTTLRREFEEAAGKLLTSLIGKMEAESIFQIEFIDIERLRAHARTDRHDIPAVDLVRVTIKRVL